MPLFVLVVDDFLIKYFNERSTQHSKETLINAGYEVSFDIKAKHFVGITLDYNRNKRWLELSCPGYVAKLLRRFAHRNVTPAVYNAIKYSQENQQIIIDDSENLSDAEIKEAQHDAPTLTAVTKAVTSLGGKNI